MTNLLVQRLGWTLIHFVWEGLLVSLLLAITLLLTRKSNPIWRYGFACGALVLMAIAPLLTFIATAPVGVQGEELDVRVIDQVVTPYLPSLVLGWGVGASLLAIRLIGGLLQIERLKRHSVSVSEDWLARFQSCANRLNINRNIKFLESPSLYTPCAVGIFRAVIMLPAEMMTRLPAHYIEALVLHELAHVRRHDYLVNLLQSMLETILFYHPAVWWVSRVVRNEREHCCDDIAVRALGEPLTYANALTQLEEHRNSLPRYSVAANGGTLLSRIQRLLGIQLPTRFVPTAWPLAAVLALSLTATTAAVQAQTKPTSTPKKTAKSTKKKSASKKTKSVAKSSSVAKPQASVPASPVKSLFAIRNVPAGEVSKPAAVAAVAAGAPGNWNFPTYAATAPGPVGALPASDFEGGRGRRVFNGSDEIVSSHERNEMLPIQIRPIGGSDLSQILLEKASAKEALLQAADHFGIGVVLGKGQDEGVSMFLPRANFEELVKAICSATGWSYTLEGKTYRISIEQTATKPSTKPDLNPMVTVSVSNTPFLDIVTALFKSNNISFELEPGKYGNVTADIKNVSLETALQMLCKQVNAQLIRMPNSYRIKPISNTAD